jgi:exodeoxyribonuclease V beta subunit
MMGDFTYESLTISLESTRNRFGAMLHAGAMEEIEKRISRLISDALFCTLTQGNRYKEQMIHHKGNLGVIDLLVEGSDGWVIIDYKSGREEEQKHREQIHRYADAVRTLSGVEVEGYLCYLLEEGVEWIKCL